MKKRLFGFLMIVFLAHADDAPLLVMPPHAKLVFDEDWSTKTIDPGKWYVLQKRWGTGNNGVVRQNVFIDEDEIGGKRKPVLICRGHGDQYKGSVSGWQGKKERVGGVIVSKPFFASGRFEVVMKIGEVKSTPGGPQDPTRPIGMVPAIWTYGYRCVRADKETGNIFSKDFPLYNPHLNTQGYNYNEYWSELDFPEFGKDQNLSVGLYNGFLNCNHQSLQFSTHEAIDGHYHTFTTLWRTELRPLPKILDEHVTVYGGYWWVQDKSVPFEDYRGNPLKRLGKDQYALYAGKEAIHFIDGKYVGANRTFVPAMSAQLNIGVWFPGWGGDAPWEESSISVASVKVWQFDDPGDVRDILTEDISNNMDERGIPK